MRAVLLAVNASFSHNSLAARYLAAACRESGVPLGIVESNINERAEVITARLVQEAPDILLCSVYIWNRRLMEDVCTRISVMYPKLKIVWGGPEVGGSLEEMFSRLPFLAYLCQGEGEEVLPSLLKSLGAGEEPCGVGISSRQYMERTVATVKCLDTLPDPYEKEPTLSPHKLHYFESSRGCPYNCAYCLSARESGVRFMSLAVAKKRLEALSAKVQLIKFVDRTFNADPARARELWQYLLDLPGDCRFHFEICAHLLTEQDFALLDDPRAARFQFEVGLQSTFPSALAAINRPMNPGAVLDKVERLVADGRIEVHLDLIAGLPSEGMTDFLGSLNAALAVRPQRLHLGFLKVLPGTALTALRERDDYGILPYAPYEVLRTPVMTPLNFAELKELERALERFYNGRRSKAALSYALQCLLPSELLAQLARAGEGLVEERLYLALATSVPDAALLQELSRFDFLALEPHRQLPPSLAPGAGDEGRLLREIVYGELEQLWRLLPSRQGEKPGSILRSLRLGVFCRDTMEHLGFAESNAIIFDHARPINTRMTGITVSLD